VGAFLGSALMLASQQAHIVEGMLMLAVLDFLSCLTFSTHLLHTEKAHCSSSMMLGLSQDDCGCRTGRCYKLCCGGFQSFRIENPPPFELPQVVRTVQKHPYVGNI